MHVSQILFFTRPWQAKFHLALAKSLKEKYPGVPVKFASFFSLAKEMAEAEGYECVYMPEELGKTRGDEITDERFAEIDRELYEKQGANFNLLLQSERFLPEAGPDAALFGRRHLVVLDRLVGEGTLLVSTAPDHFVYWLAGALANSRGGAHMSFSACGLPPNSVMALRTMWTTWSVPYKGDAEAFMKECRERLYTPGKDRIEYLKPRIIPPLHTRLKQRYHEVKCEERDTETGSYFPGSKIFSLQTITNKLPQGLFKYPEPDYDVNSDGELAKLKGPLCYLPLHMEPESTILMFSPWLRDQIELCRLVSQALPVGWKLLIKDNKAMKGVRKPEFHRKLKSLPNAVLVSPEVPSTPMILASAFTMVLTGTAGMEAALLGKPAIALGRPPSVGMLLAGDISAKLFLNDLFKKFQQKEFTLSLDAWKAWIAGTFKARIVPDYAEDGAFCTPYDKENIEAYTGYITEALKVAE